MLKASRQLNWEVNCLHCTTNISSAADFCSLINNYSLGRALGIFVTLSHDFLTYFWISAVFCVVLVPLLARGCLERVGKFLKCFLTIPQLSVNRATKYMLKISTSTMFFSSYSFWAMESFLQSKFLIVFCLPIHKWVCNVDRAKQKFAL